MTSEGNDTFVREAGIVEMPGAISPDLVSSVGCAYTARFVSTRGTWVDDGGYEQSILFICDNIE